MTIKPQPSPKTRQATLFHVALACAAIVTPASALAQQTATPQSAPATPPASITGSPGQPIQGKSAGPASTQKPPDRAAAYYHFGLAHMYEDMATNYGRPEYATRAIEEYKLALDADPSSKYLNSGLAELYLRTGRVRDAVLAAQDILKTEPDNLDAHKLLGRVYLQSLGNVQNGGPSEKV